MGLTPSGEYLSEIGEYGSGSGLLFAPTGVAADSSGNVWVVDPANGYVQKWVP
jgi:hypothetical protein